MLYLSSNLRGGATVFCIQKADAKLVGRSQSLLVFQLMNVPPNNLDHLAVYKNIPERPTARVELAYAPDTKCVICTVYEREDANSIARFDGKSFAFGSSQYDPKTKTRQESWTSWSNIPHVKNELEALCLTVLRASDVFCPGQARSDFPKAVRSPFWAQLAKDMRQLQLVAAVMLI